MVCVQKVRDIMCPLSYRGRFFSSVVCCLSFHWGGWRQNIPLRFLYISWNVSQFRWYLFPEILTSLPAHLNPGSLLWTTLLGLASIDVIITSPDSRPSSPEPPLQLATPPLLYHTYGHTFVLLVHENMCAGLGNLCECTGLETYMRCVYVEVIFKFPSLWICSCWSFALFFRVDFDLPNSSQTVVSNEWESLLLAKKYELSDHMREFLLLLGR